MITLRQAFEKKYPNYMKVLDRFTEATNEPCEWENLTKANLYTFANYMSDSVATTSARTYIAMFKSVLNLYSDSVDLPRGWEDVLSVKKDVSEHVYLTIDEISRIAAYSPKNKREWAIRNAFVISCFTGARHSDAIMLTKSNIKGNFIVYVSKKTHIKASVPVSSIVERMMDENEREGLVDVRYSEPTFNDTIRRICRNVGICQDVTVYTCGKYSSSPKYEFVASHTARRSFATNLYLYKVKGHWVYDILRISKMCGHADINMTMGYIMEERPFNDDEYSFFSQI